MLKSELTDLYLKEEDNKYGKTPESSEYGYKIEHVKSMDISYINSLDLQTSKFHQETLIDHVCFVTAKMAEITNYNKIAIIIAILHDCGKKYTIKINKKGDICFYGHERLSAEIACDFIRSHTIEIKNRDLDTVYAVISNHLELKSRKDESLSEFVNEFKSLYGDEAFDLLQALDEADWGIINGSTQDEINKYYDYVKKGEQIVLSTIMSW